MEGSKMNDLPSSAVLSKPTFEPFSVSKIMSTIETLSSKLKDDNRLAIDADEIKKIVHVQAQFFAELKKLLEIAKEKIKIGFTQKDGEVVEYFFTSSCFVFVDKEGGYVTTRDYTAIAEAFRHMNPLETDKGPTFAEFINQQFQELVGKITSKCNDSSSYFEKT